MPSPPPEKKIVWRERQVVVPVTVQFYNFSFTILINFRKETSEGQKNIIYSYHNTAEK